MPGDSDVCGITHMHAQGGELSVTWCSVGECKLSLDLDILKQHLHLTSHLLQQVLQVLTTHTVTVTRCRSRQGSTCGWVGYFCRASSVRSCSVLGSNWRENGNLNCTVSSNYISNELVH